MRPCWTVATRASHVDKSLVAGLVSYFNGRSAYMLRSLKVQQRATVQ
jgi:hypothetical protein